MSWSNPFLLYSRCFFSNFSRIHYKYSTSSIKLKNAKVAVVGSGPAALYTAQYVLKNFNYDNERLTIDIYERLPVPFGLVRYGVAPDHQDVKNVINSFTDTLLKPGVNFYGNVSVGTDLKISELLNSYTAVVLAYGSHSENYLNIKVHLIFYVFFVNYV